MRVRSVTAILMAMMLVSCEPMALRQVIEQRVVSNLILYVDASAAGGGDGNSWNTAYCYLWDALYRAIEIRSVTGLAPRIYVAEGVYYPDDVEHRPRTSPGENACFSPCSGVRIYGGFPSGGGPRDPEEHRTVLSGDIDHNDRTDPDGVTADPSDIVGANAGCVLGCLADDIYEPSMGPETVFDGITVAAGDQGMRLEARYSATCAPTVSHCVFQGNMREGLAIRTESSGTCSPWLERVVFSCNTSGLTVSTLAGGSASPVLVNVSFLENAGGTGARIDAGAGVVAIVIINAWFEGNGSGWGDGGAVSCTVGAYGSNSLEFVNSVFVGNTATRGGAVYGSGDSSTGVLDISFINSTFTRNVTQSGGAFYGTDSNVLFENSILWQDSASVTGKEICMGPGTMLLFTACDVAGSGGSAAWNLSLGTDGGGNIDLDPLFARDPDPGDGNWSTLADNDYGDLALSGGSPAVDTGQSSLLPPDTIDLDADDDTSEDLPFDIEGNPREAGARVDMGACESP